MELRVVLLTIGMLAIAMAGIAIKILVKKNGEFAGTCASNNPMFQNEEGGCSYCGATKDEVCKKGGKEEFTPAG
ncbi:MAG: membrane or secreted protein [Bacteroidota bacterium]|nr:membrane or secreted protein [Bacteroidota bacterium]